MKKFLTGVAAVTAAWLLTVWAAACGGGGNNNGGCKKDQDCPNYPNQFCDLTTNTCKCKPQCTGKCGGPDGCGGTCQNTCPSGQTCQAPDYTTCSQGDCIDITAYKYPKASPDISIPPQTAVNYCFTIDSDANKVIQITMSSRDWWTSSHVLMSDIRNQTKEEIVSIIESGSTFNTYPNPPPWYSFAAGSNERVYIQNYPGKTGQRFYVTVYNTEPEASSFIQLNWIAY